MFFGRPNSALSNGHTKCFLICAALALASFQYGCDTAIVNGFQATPGFVEFFGKKTPSGGFIIETHFQQLITSLLQVGLIVASIVVGPFSIIFGRRFGFFIASILSFIGLTVQVLASTQTLIYVGRLLLGLANGLYVNLLVLYISECSPVGLRGSMVSLFQPLVSTGTFIGAVISNAFHEQQGKTAYKSQLYILYAVPAWIAIVVWLLPESPRWLAVRGDSGGALRSLRRLRGAAADDASIRRDMEVIELSIETERYIAKHTSWIEIWTGADRRRTLLTISCATFHAASGVNFLIGYGTFFYQQAGLKNPFLSTVISQSVSVMTAILSIPAAKIFGRRTILIFGFSVTTFSMFGVAVLYTVDPGSEKLGKSLVALLTVYLAAYSGTIGPLSWVAAGEIPNTRLRSWTFGVAMSVGFFFAWLTIFTTPYFINANALNWGAKVAWIWAPSNLATLVFIYFYLPETRGRTLEELDDFFYKSGTGVLGGSPLAIRSSASEIDKGKEIGNKSNSYVENKQ